MGRMRKTLLATPNPVRISTLLCLAMLTCVTPLWSQSPPGGKGGKAPGPFFRLSGSLVHQFEADLEREGSYSVSTMLLRASVAQPVSRKTILGLSLGYDLSDYDFSEDAGLDSATPWDKVHALNLSFPIIRKIPDRWSMLISPSIGSYGASGASLGDTLTWGVVLAATYEFKPDRRLGFGVGAFDRIGESRGFPFLAIDWRLSERWKITNPLNVGPTGPAGLELAYKLGDLWELGFGGTYRTVRFRLDEQDLEPNGIGEQRGVLTFARLLRTLGPKIRLEIYSGWVFGGELRVEDEDGRQRRTAEHDTAPLLAISLSGRF